MTRYVYNRKERSEIMEEIKCPKCGTVFQISATDYESILKQIRDKEFEKEINFREEQYKREKDDTVNLVKVNAQMELQESLKEKELEINELKNELKNKEEQTRTLTEKKFQEELNKRMLEISNLKNKLEVQEANNKLEIKTAITEKENEITSLYNKLELQSKEHDIKEKSIKESYEIKLKDKDEQIAYYKDFKIKQSTKMVGESLEQHCSREFNRLRPLFKNAYFEKDNDVRTGSKGDFIFRDYDDNGIEFVSIMFEMKNEADQTATKHKNEHFFKELDKDRNEKKCEYAVLVSMLESDNDYYNDGIVDVSYLYDKMYVIRPQFFIPLITLIRSLASKSLEYKKELEYVRNQNIDINNFEENINKFKTEFGNRYRWASDRFSEAIKKIDATIKNLEDIKKALTTSDEHLRIANQKAEDLTIKSLTKNNPTMAQMFKELENKKEERLSDDDYKVELFDLNEN